MVAQVTKFPTVGSFAGSELINLKADKGWCTAKTMGIVLSVAKVPVEGAFDLIGIDTRVLTPFASFLSDEAEVSLTISKETIVFKSGARELSTVAHSGRNHTLPKYKDVGGVEQFDVSKNIGQRAQYLSSIAFAGSAKPELCAVMMSGDGNVMACNQKVVAVLGVAATGIGRCAIPVPLAGVISEGHEVWAGPADTVIKNGNSWFVMPSPSIAQANFPVEQIKTMGTHKRTPVAIVSGETFAAALNECSTCAAQSSKTESILRLTINESNVELFSSNAGAKFSTTLDATQVHKAGTVVHLPMDELLHVAPIVSTVGDVTVGVGPNSETFLTFDTGWIMFTAFNGKK